jgi:hypothetical protein
VLGQLDGVHCQKLVTLLLAPPLPFGAIGQEQLIVLPILVGPPRQEVQPGRVEGSGRADCRHGRHQIVDQGAAGQRVRTAS